MEIADFLEKWQTDERSVEESLEYLKSFLTIFSSLSRDDQQRIIEEYEWEIFGKFIDCANLPGNMKEYWSFFSSGMEIIHKYSRPRTVYMMISERLVTINAPFGYSLLLEGMEKALLSLPIGFLHLGLDGMMQGLRDSQQRYVDSSLKSNEEHIKSLQFFKDYSYRIKTLENTYQDAKPLDFFVNQVLDSLILLERLVAGIRDVSECDLEDDTENDVMLQEDTLVHFLLLLMDVVSVIKVEYLRHQICVQAASIFRNLDQRSPSLLPSLLNHAHRIRAITYYLNNDCVTKLQYVDSENEPRKQFREAFKDLSMLSPQFSNVENVALPEVFVPWTSITSTGAFMAEIINHHRREITLRDKKMVVAQDQNENEDESLEDDLQTIKESRAREITRKFQLHRTSVSLRWSLSGISLLLLSHLKSNELNSPPALILWEMYLPYIFMLLSNAHIASNEGLEFLHLLVKSISRSCDTKRQTFYASLLTLSWREDCLFNYIYYNNWKSSPNELSLLLQQINGATRSIEMFGLTQLIINAMVQTSSEASHINSFFALRYIALELLTPFGALVLLRKLLDCCPFPQAKGLFVDISRALFLEMAPLAHSSDQIPSFEFKRSPILPKSSQDSQVPTLPKSADSVDTKMAITHIKDMKNLESYHLKLDEYMLQFSSHHLHLSTLSSIFLDLFVIPVVKLISSDYDTAFEAIEIVDWVSSAVSLLRMLTIKLQQVPHMSSLYDTQIHRQTLNLVNLSLANIPNILNTLHEWFDQSASTTGEKKPFKSSTTSPVVFKKYEMITMNLQDTLESLDHILGSS